MVFQLSSIAGGDRGDTSLGKSYTGIMKPSVLSNSTNQAASYWSSVPHHPSFVPGLGGHAPPGSPLAMPLSFATFFSGYSCACQIPFDSDCSLLF